MNTYETSARVLDQGEVRVAGVPFAPGTQVAVTIRRCETLTRTEDETLAAAQARMRELFRTVKGFRMSPKIPREELYERGSLP